MTGGALGAPRPEAQAAALCWGLGNSRRGAHMAAGMEGTGGRPVEKSKRRGRRCRGCRFKGTRHARWVCQSGRQREEAGQASSG